MTSLEKPLDVCHHPAKIGGHRRCCIGEIMVLVCHVISQDHVTKELSKFMGRSPSK